MLDILPQALKNILRPIYLFFARIALKGDQVFCPICSNSAKAFLNWKASKACIFCGSLERQRAIYLWLTKKSKNFGPNSKVLHIAPDPALVPKIKSQVQNYISADLYDTSATVKADITKLPFANKSFDLVICSHVLEHIDQDHLAMKELNRVMTSGGELLILVPLKKGDTYEDLTVINPKEREQHFGQSDHVRIYGMDITKRLENAGLQVSSFPAPAILQNSAEVEKFGLLEHDVLFVCKNA